ncbi:MAG: RNA-binding S4 domain-containing protein [Paracoccaceae bacterium]
MAGPGGKPDAKPRLRIDRWLWQARFFKSRPAAAEAVQDGYIRVNGTPIHKAGRDITPGDTLTIPQGDRIRLIRVTALGLRRGPSTEAQSLYIDLDVAAGRAPAAPDPLE